MSDTVACLWAFAFFVLMTTLNTLLLRHTRNSGGPTLNECIEAYPKVEGQMKYAVLLLATIPVLRILVRLWVGGISFGGFAALAAICGGSAGLVAEIRKIIFDVFEWLDHFFHVHGPHTPAPPAGPDPHLI